MTTSQIQILLGLLRLTSARATSLTLLTPSAVKAASNGFGNLRYGGSASLRRRLQCSGLLIAGGLTILSTRLLGQGTAFTYEGQLESGGAPANGLYDIRAGIWTTNTGGTIFAGPITNSAVAVSNGLFLITLDYGEVFDGTGFWLQIGVRTNGGGAFTTLLPRQELTPTPYAITAENLDGSLSSSSLFGIYSNALTLSNPSNQFVGNGLGLAEVNAVTLGGLASSNFWTTTGNAGTSPTNGNFLGTTDNNPLELHVNSSRALRLEPIPNTGNISNMVNVIGGSPINSVTPGYVGATIGGGGSSLYIAIGARPNSVGGDFGTIGGGGGNSVSATGGTVAGGLDNYAGGINVSTISGGQSNQVSGPYDVVGGGFNNTGSGSLFGGCTTVAGGANNSALGDYTTVGGGAFNQAKGTTYGFSTIAGGATNSAGSYATVAGGVGNVASGFGSFIGGGGYAESYYAGNSAKADASMIGGGFSNIVASGATYAVIGGGEFNTNSGLAATVAGGQYNTASGQDAVVGGGYNNRASALSATIAGGANNIASLLDATVGGGDENVATHEGDNVTGGESNEASGGDSTVAGGTLNTASGTLAIVCGGDNNTASGLTSFAAGNEARAVHDGAFVWADDWNFFFSSTTTNGFFARCTGGAKFVTAINGTTGDVTAGVQVGPGGTSWSAICDRNAKKNFQALDTVAVLNKLAAIPIERWNYKWEADTDTPNIGPMAQDFKAAFYPGRDDKTISTLEFDGVALAAIQGLNQKLTDKDTLIRQQAADIESLKARLQKIEQLLQATK